MPVPLTLDKAVEEVQLTLTKAGIVEIPNDINVTLLMDISYSMSSVIGNGKLSDVLKRVLSISKTIDDDGILQLIPFHSNAYHYGAVEAEMYNQSQSLINDCVNKYGLQGTEYKPALMKAIDVLSIKTETTIKKEPKGFFGKLFGSGSSEVTYGKELPGKQLIVLLTDGEPQDTSEFESYLSEVFELIPNAYLQCVSVGYFSNYLQAIADKFNSVGHTSVKSFEDTDENLINAIVNKESLNRFLGK